MRVGVLTTIILLVSMSKALGITCAMPTVEEEYALVSAVFEAKVLSKVKTSSGTKIHLQVGKVWKTDRKPLDVLTGDSGFKVGTSYIIFAKRAESFWSFLPWIDEPLWDGVCSLTVESEVPEKWQGSDSYAAMVAARRAYLDAQLETPKSPNKTMEPTR